MRWYALMLLGLIWNGATPRTLETTALPLACAQAHCRYVPGVINLTTVYVENEAWDSYYFQLNCNHVTGIVGHIRNGTSAPVYDVRVVGYITELGGTGTTLSPGTMALRRIEPGAVMPFFIESGHMAPDLPAYVIKIESWQTAPDPLYRPITVVAFEDNPPSGDDIEVVLKNNHAEPVSDLVVAFFKASLEVGYVKVNVLDEQGEPVQLQPGESYTLRIPVVPRHPSDSAFGPPIGAEGRATRATP